MKKLDAIDVYRSWSERLYLSLLIAIGTVIFTLALTLVRLFNTLISPVFDLWDKDIVFMSLSHEFY